MKKPENRKSVRPVQTQRFGVQINGRRLECEKIGDRWTFSCPAWPDLVAEHNGAESAEGIVRAFTALALADAVEVIKG